jgi:hypothetical protein
MATPEHVVDTLKRKYGRISKIVIKGTEEEVFFRGLNFEEYIKVITKTNKMTSDKTIIYDFDPDILPYIITTCKIYPELFDTDKIMLNPGLMYNIASYIMQITLFEDDDRLEKYYVDRYRVYSTVLGSIRMKLVAYFGLDGYTQTKNMTQEEIIDLLAMGELLNREPGEFSKVINKPLLFPRDRRGRVDLKRFLAGIENYTPQQSPTQAPVEMKEDHSFDHAANLYSDNENEAVLTRTSRNRKESSNMSFDDMQREAMEVSKIRLAEQIARDKARFGNEAIKLREKGQRRFLGRVEDLDPNLKTILKQ